MRKLLAFLLVLVCLLNGSALAENMTVEQLLVSDTWVFTHDHQNYMNFKADGTGDANGFAMTWKTSLFGVTAECEYFGSTITANYNLIAENDLPVLQLSDGSGSKLMRRCDLGDDQQQSAAPEAPAALTEQEAVGILTGEAWSEAKAGGNRYTFAADGTGKMDLGSNFVLDTKWTLEGDQLTLNYDLYGERTLSCTLGEEDGMYRLTYGENGFLVRESDAQALIIAGRENLNAYAVSVAEPVSLGFTNISFENAMTSRKVIGPANSGSVLMDKPGYTYLTVLGSIKNNTGSEVSMRSLCAEIQLDQAYTYGATVMVELGEELKYDIPAQASGKLYISVALPEDVAMNYTDATVYLGFNDGFSSAPGSVGEAGYIFSFELTDGIVAASKLGPIRKMTYFEECPVLPVPASFVDLRFAGSSSSSLNGKTTRIEYTYTCEYDGDSVEQLLESYKNELAAAGFAVKNGDVYAGKTKVASLTIRSGKVSVNIVPGNEKLKFTPNPSAPAAVQESADIPEEIVYTLGQTLKLDTMQMKLDKTGRGTIYSSVTEPASGHYRYIEGTNGNELFYLTGTYKNTGGVPVDIRNIYAEFTFDGKYTYRGDVEGAAPKATFFIDDIAPMESVTFYAYAQVPASVLSSYKTCTARIGFTDAYSTKFTTSGGLLNFEYCDDIFSIDLSPGAKASSSASGSTSAYKALKPGSKGQEVLDARMKLYELGYFKKKPTQTEYTNNMKDYVRKFEKDNGLKQDGLLSPEDQEVLFSL